MNFADLVRLYFERSVALQNYWTVYVGVIGGLLAFSTLRKSPNRVKTILITILYLCFAYKNCAAIVEVTGQREKIAEAARSAAATAGDGVQTSRELILPTLTGTDAGSAQTFHYVCDGLTVVAIWSMEWRRRKGAREVDAAA